ncbi:replication factor A protein 3 [Serendipita vermifera]|nr:replication factor A protein 3 [Serendipita vermifera]
MELKSPRVNAARMPNYIGQSVSVVAKVIKLTGNSVAIVELSDGGQIEVRLSADSHMRDSYVEIIGRVENANTLKMQTVLNLGDKIDMAVVNHTIELMHTPAMSQYWHTKP